MSKKILVIEDDQDVYEFLEAFLADKGYTVEVANNGKDGFERIRRFQPDLVVLDLMMPTIDGFGVLKLIGESPMLKKPKIIVLTAVDRMGGIEEALHLGASAYLFKPVETPRLIEKIKELI